MLSVALTGGIASGKSKVAELFSAYDVPIIDADVIARELTQVNTPCWQAIREHFSDSVLNQDQQLNRRALRELIFNNDDARLWLNQLLHPEIRLRMQQELKQLHSAYAICVIPLLSETSRPEFIDRICVVDCPEAMQLQRLQQRDQCSAKQAQKILDSQANRQQRLSIADDVIDNSGNIEQLEAQVAELHQAYLGQ